MYTPPPTPMNRTAGAAYTYYQSQAGKPTNESKGCCFIATAAYGTPFAEEIQILRDWRDNYLQKYELGNYFIKFYYWFSPPIANIIRNNHNLKKLTRVLLNPIVKYLKKSMQAEDHHL